MAVSVIIGRTNKAINSTSQTFADSVSLSCRLKEPCSQQSPVFIVQGLSKTVYYNFAQFMGKYYWVDDIVYLTNDVQEVHCHLDPLASYKGAIENTYAFVQYGAEDLWNEYVDDVRFSPEARAPEANFDDEFDCIPGLASDPSDGYVIMRYMDCGMNGGVKTIAMTLPSFWDMLDDLGDIFDNTTTIGEISAAMGGQGSWRDNILSCVYVPVTNIDTSDSVSMIRLGGVRCNVSGYMQAAIINRTITNTLSLNYTTNYFTNCPFMRNPRWVSCQISTPFGCTEIPFDLIKSTLGTFNMYMRATLDVITGDVTIKFTDKADGVGVCLASFSGNVGADMMSMLGSGMNFGKGFTNSLIYGGKLAVNAFTAGLSMGTSAQIAAKAATPSASDWKNMSTAEKLKALDTSRSAEQRATISSGISELPGSIPTFFGNSGLPSGNIGSGFSALYLTTNPGKGSIAFRLTKPLSNLDYKSFCDMYGYPVNGYNRLSASPGWTKCSGASVQGALGATEANKSTINSYLNSGIIIEA